METVMKNKFNAFKYLSFVIVYIFNIVLLSYVQEIELLMLLLLPFIMLFVLSLIFRLEPLHFLLIFPSIILFYIWNMIFPKKYGSGISALSGLNDIFDPILVYASELAGFVIALLLKHLFFKLLLKTKTKNSLEK